MDMEKYIWEGRELSISGNLPQKGVFISCRANPYISTCRDLYLCALEATLNGYGVIYIPSSFGADCIEQGVIDGKGKLFSVYPHSIDSRRRKNLSKALISGGGEIAPFHDEKFSIDSLNMAKCIGAYLSTYILAGEDSYLYHYTIPYIDYALDSGKDIAILRSALISPSMRRLAKEGCPIVSSFSTLLQSPDAIGFKSQNGRYSILSENFDIIYIDGSM